MEKSSAPAVFDRSFNLPFLMGYFLAANAVRDLCALVEGSNCVMQKVDLLAGNHDLYSTLLSDGGDHRVVCSMGSPLSPQANPEKKLSAVAASLASSGRYGAVAVTGLPYCRLAGMDFEGVVRAARGKAPLYAVQALSMEGDWLDGYDLTLEGLAKALPLKGRPSPRKAAIAGYFLDRNERDHAANLAGLKRLLALCGLELVSVWADGGDCAGLARAGEAGLVISLPYGRRTAAALAARTGARLLEAGLPLGITGTSAWLAAARRAAGLKGPLPPAVRDLERAALDAVFPALRALAAKRLLFAGDPYLYAALAAYAGELAMDFSAAFLCSAPRAASVPLPAGPLLFAPSPAAAARALAGLPLHARPDAAVSNSFGASEGLTGGAPLVELGFPSYGRHCLTDEPFLGYDGAVRLAGLLLNALVRRGG